MSAARRTTIWSCGGGVQSTAIAALIVSGRLHRPDLAVMSDTEREASATWAYFDAVLRPRLAEVGVELVRVAKSQYESSDLWQCDGELLAIPAFYRQSDGSTAKKGTHCAARWKERVVQRWARAQGVKAADVWIGYSVDEMRRVRAQQMEWWRLVYPLIDARLSRAACLGLVERMGWPTPPRSACWMCPNRSDKGWSDMKERWPDDFHAAVSLEAELRAVDDRIRLHRSGAPLGQVAFEDANQNQLDLFGSDCAGGCWT